MTFEELRFSDIGEFVCAYYPEGANGFRIRVSVLKDPCADDAFYAASDRPRVVGVGKTPSDAYADWVKELDCKRAIARNLNPPYADDTAKDIAAINRFFGEPIQ